ncbi:DUF4760 domain-containing protein [Brevundimonas bacteroides]|uniref:DUF4760 domain-containing protein n=1 Tax=Brevundimonas bacteroides TaxID=74311 RepID=UPI000A04F917|nr:DUF4760 domain-containing protein [Brevundimonas bacteroides]
MSDLALWVPPSPGNWEPYLEPLATIISVAIAALGLWIAGAQSRSDGHERCVMRTLEYIQQTEYSEQYMHMTRVFSRYRRRNSFTELHNPPEYLRPDRFAVLGYLNHYETIALFIEKKALDGPTYRDWIAGAIFRDWNAAADFIQRERWNFDNESGQWSYDQRRYSSMQKLVCKWSPSAKPLTQHSGGPPDASQRKEPLEAATEPKPAADSQTAETVENPNH